MRHARGKDVSPLQPVEAIERLEQPGLVVEKPKTLAKPEQSKIDKKEADPVYELVMPPELDLGLCDGS